MHGADYNDTLDAAATNGVPVALPLPVEGGLWVALAPPAHPALPGELLRELRTAGHEVQGFVDRAAVLAAWLPQCPQLVVLGLSRRQFSVDLAVRAGDMAALRRHVHLPGGMQSLHDAWLRLAAATLVQQTRFDPLHDLRHEQALRGQLPQLAAGAQRQGQALLQLETGNGEVTLALTRDQLAAAAQPVLAPLANALQALAAAYGDATLLVPHPAAEIPGLQSVLVAARFARLCGGAGDLAARAASLLQPSGATADAGVPYRTSMPLFTEPAPDGLLEPLFDTTGAARPMATHVVWQGGVVPISSGGLVVGRAGDVALSLPEGLAGISRRHCTLRREGGRTQVIDHSTHGTFVDGARVRGRALLPAGAVLRLGDPGIELPLVAIGAQ
ncbi:MAG TPA: FHA domain-containing protein [Steroidobacteraceae bacterium]|nr:FHA domain-containing protein [Steroidobacteraceae bacterium]